MKYKILAIILVLLAAVIISGCVVDIPGLAEPDTIELGVPYDFVQPEPNQEYINNTLEVWVEADTIHHLQTGESLKINDKEYEGYFPHTIIVIPDNQEQRVMTCDYKLCNQDSTILIGDNPCNYTDKSRTMLFLNEENAFALYRDGYNCPYLWMQDQAHVVEFNNIYVCNVEMVSVLHGEDFE